MLNCGPQGRCSVSVQQNVKNRLKGVQLGASDKGGRLRVLGLNLRQAERLELRLEVSEQGCLCQGSHISKHPSPRPTGTGKTGGRENTSVKEFKMGRFSR